jgi:hypothetical protein
MVSLPLSVVANRSIGRYFRIGGEKRVESSESSKKKTGVCFSVRTL